MKLHEKMCLAHKIKLAKKIRIPIIMRAHHNTEMPQKTGPICKSMYLKEIDLNKMMRMPKDMMLLYKKKSCSKDRELCQKIRLPPKISLAHKDASHDDAVPKDASKVEALLENEVPIKLRSPHSLRLHYNIFK